MPRWGPRVRIPSRAFLFILLGVILRVAGSTAFFVSWETTFLICRKGVPVMEVTNLMIIVIALCVGVIR